jgi:hypothetical protein
MSEIEDLLKDIEKLRTQLEVFNKGRLGRNT